MKGSDILIQNNSFSNGEIVLYQPNESIRLEVRIEQDTVWLTQAQMVELFHTSKQNISLHIGNIFREGELDKNVVVKYSFTTTRHGAMPGKCQQSKVLLYNLDVIISVGYRVKNQIGTRFRQWANNIIKQHMFGHYCINRQLVAFQERTDERFLKIENQLDNHQKQLDFFIATNTPPAEMVFFEGDFYKARVALENLVKTAKERVVIVDAYVNVLTLDILNERAAGVEAVVYTSGVGEGMQRLMAEHDRLFPEGHIDIRKWRNQSHDRWLIVDDRLYHCGHSLNGNGGHKISAITLMGTPLERILSEIENPL